MSETGIRMRSALARNPTRRLPTALILAAGPLGLPAAALAHAGLPVAPHDLAAAWNLSPLLLAGLMLTAFRYWRGVTTCWERAGPGQIVPAWRVVAFAAGILTLVIALISPLDALAGALFAAHMSQHLLLTLVAAPLLLLGAPGLALLWSLPPGWRRQIGRWSRRPAVHRLLHLATGPVVVSLLYAGVLWAWHLPRLYDAALADDLVHAIEHATLLGTALLFWDIFIRRPGRRRTGHGIAILVAFAAMLQGALLSAMLTFSDAAWYGGYASSTIAWGLSPLDDQRLAGAIMMMPTGLAYLAAAVMALVGWLRTAERRQADRVSTGRPRAEPILLTEAEAPR